MVLDLDRWRRLGNVTSSLENWINIFGLADLDQLALNMEFQGRIDILDWRWNVNHLAEKFQEQTPAPEKCIKEARILHFQGPCKPWRPCNNLHRDVFQAY